MWVGPFFHGLKVPDYVVRWEDGVVAKTDSVIEK